MRINRVFWFCGALALLRLQSVAQTPPQKFDNSLVDGPAMVKTWAPPVYPAEALRENVGGIAVIRIVVDETGALTAARVLRAGDQRLGEAALVAVKAWTFAPAVDGEKRVTSCLDVPLTFDPKKGQKSWPASYMTNLSNHPRPAPVTGAEPRRTPTGEYPALLSERKLPGRVDFSCWLDATGRVSAPKILGASHADFVLPALVSLAKWEFTPSKQGDLAVATELVGEVSFDTIASNRAEVLAANGITAPDGTVPEVRPQPSLVADAAWPYAPLVRGEGGEAVVEFTVGMSGSVSEVKVRSASSPDFGRAAEAAMEGWRFQRAINDGRRGPVVLVKKFEFAAVPAAAANPEIQDEWTALVNRARAGSIGAPQGLDEKLTPILRVPPVYPAALKAAGGPKGEAEIEFVIARDGRARLPKIVSASHEEFGWAAATAVAQWVFKAPQREGRPVDVRVSIPISFASPQN
jgi:TonB family protein